MFIDADIHFDPKSILNLLESGHDITVACYPKKVIMWDQGKDAAEKGDTRDMAMLTSSLVVNFGAQQLQVTNGYVQILDGPTGFMLIKRDVISRMNEHFKESLECANDHQNRDFDTYVALFDCMIDPVSRRYLSEDYAFCRRWQQMGGTIYAHVLTTLGHVGNLPFYGKLSERLKDETSKKTRHEAIDNSPDEK
jgi:hypothetical protein